MTDPKQDRTKQANGIAPQKSPQAENTSDIPLSPAEEIPPKRNDPNESSVKTSVSVFVQSGHSGTKVYGCNNRLGKIAALILGIVAGSIAALFAAGALVILLTALAGLLVGGLVLRLLSPRENKE